jgi:diaminohydroxyphosphoribosylaminopyrimidine deaminase/5-amino-6-(5-phosphoribosylamino)uracil reductase
LEDNPSLTTRHVEGKNPTRIVIDLHNNLPRDRAVFNSEARTIVLNSENLYGEKPLAQEICDVLFDQNIISVIVEGGPKTLQGFIDENLWDEARVFQSNTNFGVGVKGPQMGCNVSKKIRVGQDHLELTFNSK